MPKHISPGARFDNSHGNKIRTRTAPTEGFDVRKVRADTVPYGESISPNGETVWVAYDGERLLCVAATAEEARRKGRAAIQRRAKT